MTTYLPPWKVVSKSNRFIVLADDLERDGVCSVAVARDRAARIYVELVNDCFLWMDGGSVLVEDG